MFARMRKTGFGLLALGGALTAMLLVLASAASAKTLNVSGTWNANYHCEVGWCAGEDFPAPGVVLTQAPGSDIVGTGGGTFGTLVGNSVMIHSGSPGEYQFTETLNFSADGESWTGPLSDSNGTSGTDTGTRVSGEPFELSAQEIKEANEAKEAAEAKLAKEKKEKENAVKRPTATTVTCNYEFATSDNTCVAAVGDAGTGTPVTPTGTVTFTTTSGGFASPASCSLTPTSGSPSVGSCTLVYETANSGLPEITATYGGDSRHTGSVGHTHFLGSGSDETSDEIPPGPPGQYPNEVSLETTVPVDGTTLEASLEGTTHGAPVPLVLPPIDPSLDPTSAGELAFADKLGQIIDANDFETPQMSKEFSDEAAKILQRIDVLDSSPSPAQQTDGKLLTKQANETLEAITKMLKTQAEAQKEAIKNAKGAAFAAARHGKSKARTRSIPALAYVVRRGVPAGKLKLELHLNRAALNRLAGKHRTVSLYLRVDMVLPSKQFSGGLPRSFVQRITLKRTPAGKGHHPAAKGHKK